MNTTGNSEVALRRATFGNEEGTGNDHGSSWYAVHCKPSKEYQTAAVLKQRLGLGVYLPDVTSRVRGKEQPKPFFPGYLFIQTNLQQVRMSSINTTPGVVRLLEFGSGPMPVPNTVIHAIQTRIDALNEQGGLPTHDFLPGEQVLLKSGPLRGLQAAFVGPTTPSARVKVLLHFLGRLNEVTVDVDALERAQEYPQRGRERGTRGKGRKINNGSN
jgi:transcriptional antiterminator RfaH